MIGFKHHSSKDSKYILEGSFSIGTLAYYRELEDVGGSLIPDVEEGVAIGTHPTVEITGPFNFADLIVITDGDTDAPVEPGTPGAIGFISDNTVHNEIDDCYILCLSRTSNNDSAYPTEQYDAIAEISDLFSLAERIQATHPDRLGQFMIMDVMYYSQNYNLLESGVRQPHPFAKNPKFGVQREIRITWQALDAKPERFFNRPINVADIVRLIPPR